MNDRRRTDITRIEDDDEVGTGTQDPFAVGSPRIGSLKPYVKLENGMYVECIGVDVRTFRMALESMGLDIGHLRGKSFGEKSGRGGALDAIWIKRELIEEIEERTDFRFNKGVECMMENGTQVTMEELMARRARPITADEDGDDDYLTAKNAARRRLIGYIAVLFASAAGGGIIGRITAPGRLPNRVAGVAKPEDVKALAEKIAAEIGPDRKAKVSWRHSGESVEEGTGLALILLGADGNTILLKSIVGEDGEINQAIISTELELSAQGFNVATFTSEGVNSMQSPFEWELGHE